MTSSPRRRLLWSRDAAVECDLGELRVQLRREDLGGQVAEHREELHEHEADRLRQLGVADGSRCRARELANRTRARFDPEGREEGELLGGVVQHALGDRGERDLAERGPGPGHSAPSARSKSCRRASGVRFLADRSSQASTRASWWLRQARTRHPARSRGRSRPVGTVTCERGDLGSSIAAILEASSRRGSRALRGLSVFAPAINFINAPSRQSTQSPCDYKVARVYRTSDRFVFAHELVIVVQPCNLGLFGCSAR